MYLPVLVAAVAITIADAECDGMKPNLEELLYLLWI